jgi:hypothetical protein
MVLTIESLSLILMDSRLSAEVAEKKRPLNSIPVMPYDQVASDILQFGDLKIA